MWNAHAQIPRFDSFDRTKQAVDTPGNDDIERQENDKGCQKNTENRSCNKKPDHCIALMISLGGPCFNIQVAEMQVIVTPQRGNADQAFPVLTGQDDGIQQFLVKQIPELHFGDIVDITTIVIGIQRVINDAIGAGNKSIRKIFANHFSHDIFIAD